MDDKCFSVPIANEDNEKETKQSAMIHGLDVWK